MTKILVKRPVTIKTIVTPKFKEDASNELTKEIHLLDNQMLQLELQNKQIMDQTGALGIQIGHDNAKQIQEALNDISQKLQQMSSLKQELISQRDTIKDIALNNVIVTGSLENYVEIKIGENIYDVFKKAEIIIKDGVIEDIKN
ncbi:MAG: YlqD family protein [Candidatus Gastranaerophilaceae bacterium]|jgi:hypothetical protein